MVRGVGLQLRIPSPSPTPLLASFSLSFANVKLTRCSLAPSESADASSVSSPGGSGSADVLSARERRQLRNERRESRAGGVGWREKVEEQLLHKPKNRRKRATSWTEQLNLDNLARLGPQWWIVRVARVNAHEAADRIARSLARNFPTTEFKVYYPAVRQRRKLKNGSESEKLKPLFPGCLFLNCILNQRIHDFIREIDGVGGFVGSKVGNTIRQINKPKPVAVEDMEAIFRQTKEEQENADKEYKEEQEQNMLADSGNSINAAVKTRTRKSKKGSENSESSLEAVEGNKSLAPGANVRILSGPFSEFTGCIAKLNRRSGKVTVGLQLFGKESLVDVEVDQIVLESS
ncbi:hypothetical protein Cni_G04268 [Canna indica]|uniref:NusG-like N-terminal domain-containing protein n=1 Tax=Canna indica TaxID=4628 RepID=A0AAQ3JVN6_9LILI|nr:hypothetical protein Cni_G04268 [Canna indica]